MGSYDSWNIKNVKKQMSKVKKCKPVDYDILQDIINQDITPFPSSNNFRLRMQDDRDTIYSYHYFLDSILDFSKLDENHKMDNPLYLDEFSFSPSENIAFVYDFFKTKDKEWFKLFKEIFNERKNNLQFSDSRSLEIYISSLNYNYINICREKTVSDYFAIVHEYTHAIVDRIKFRKSYNYYPFVELPSLLMELIAKNEVIDTYAGLDNQVRTYFLATLRTILNYSKEISVADLYFSNCEDLKNYNGTLRDFIQITGYDKSYFDEFIKLTSIERLMYIIPFLTATELYYIYLEDPEKCFYILNAIINLSYSNDYSQVLKSYDIELNQSAEKLVKEIKKGF